jgi:predicted acylesterase/phospholipase RssA
MIDRRDFLNAIGGLGALGVAAPSVESPRTRALVLTGGGALGSYQGGVLAGLAARGERFDIVVGTSIGAINGAIFSQGDIDNLDDLWYNVSRYRLIQSVPTLTPLIVSIEELRDQTRGVISRPYNVLRGVGKLWDGGAVLDRTGFFLSEPVIAFLEGRIDLRKVRGIFGWATTNLTASQNESFYVAPDAFPDVAGADARHVFHRLSPASAADRELYPEAIRASAAIPLVFEPVTLRPRGAGPAQYADGGVAANAPIALALALGATDIVGVAVDPPVKPRPVRSLADVVFAAFNTNQTRLVFDQIAGKSVRSAGVIRPREPLGIGPLDFDKQAGLDAAFRVGYDDGLRGPEAVPAELLQ